MSAPEVTRRGFLGLAAGAGLAAATVQLSRTPRLLAPAAAQLPPAPFTLGVASGDPLPRRVVLWTRLAPDPQAPGGGMAPEPVTVRWEVAHDERFARVVGEGKALAKPEAAHAVHVDVGGLEPDREYFYRFIAASEQSPVGRTRSAPALGSADRVRLAFASCQAYRDGYFSAHRHLADEDVQAVLWLGDYIYESAASSGGLREHEGPEPIDIEGYRRRYATYKSDLDLQAAHAAHPWIVTWDDHEVDNNYADDRSQRDDQPVDAFLARRAAAYRVWWEHQPVRLRAPTGPDYEIYRRLPFGDLVNLHVLDTRQYRTDQPCGSPVDIGAACAGQDAPEATLLGDAQRAWLVDGLERSKARWDLVAQQVMFAPVNFSGDAANPVHNLDQWDGYKVERAEVLRALGSQPRNGVVLTGDIHSSWVNDLVDTQGGETATVATELVGTSVTSNFPLPDVLDAITTTQPTIKYVDARNHGYIRCEVSTKELRADFRYVSSIREPDTTVETGASFVIEDRTPGAQPA